MSYKNYLLLNDSQTTRLTLSILGQLRSLRFHLNFVPNTLRKYLLREQSFDNVRELRKQL